MSYSDTINEHLRITILRLLAEDNNYKINESLLLDLVGGFGFNPSRDNIRTQLAWLEEQGLLKVAKDTQSCWLAELTARGDDVAKCRTRVPGVKAPRPGE